MNNFYCYLYITFNLKHTTEAPEKTSSSLIESPSFLTSMKLISTKSPSGDADSGELIVTQIISILNHSFGKEFN